MAEVKVYQAADDRWIVLSNGVKSGYFNTESEALEMSEKVIFAEKCIDLSEALIAVIKELPAIEKVWALEGYLAGMSDGDITSTGKTKDEIAAFVTFSENFTKFLGNDNTQVIAEYGDTLYKLLRDL
jgi:hypothetical protein